MITLARQQTASFDVAGSIGLRLHNCCADDVATVGRQLGVPETEFDRDADIVIRFEDDLDPGHCRFAGGSDFGFTDDSFWVLHDRRAAVCLRMPVEHIGSRCELLCRRGSSHVPLLESLVKLAALAKGLLPLHAAACAMHDRGVAVTGFPHGAKTTTLLGCMHRGAKFIGDDLVLVDQQGRMHGSRTPLSLSDRHCDHWHRLKKTLSHRQRFAINAAGGLTRSLPRIVPGFQRGDGVLQRGMRKLDRVLQGRRKITIAPEQLFAADAFCDHHALDLVFLSIAHRSTAVEVEYTPLETFLRRLTEVLLDDLSDLIRAHACFRFAFPTQSNELLDGLAERIATVAAERLAGVKLFTVLHPYPVLPQAMFGAIEPVIASEVPCSP